MIFCYNNSLAKDFISRLCRPNPRNRYTATEALTHPWITRNFSTSIPLSYNEHLNQQYLKKNLIELIRIITFIAVENSVRQKSVISKAQSSKNGTLIKDEAYSVKDSLKSHKSIFSLHRKSSLHLPVIKPRAHKAKKSSDLIVERVIKDDSKVKKVEAKLPEIRREKLELMKTKRSKKFKLVFGRHFIFI